MGKVLILALQLIWCVTISAQLNLLTVREAESIVQLVPDFIEAESRHECPSFSPMYEAPESLVLQVRRTCGAAAGTLVENYMVNRRTGTVTLWGDDPKPVSNAATDAVSERLLSMERRRTLTVNEARCLALEASKALSGWAEEDASVSINAIGEKEQLEGLMHFTAIRRSRVSPTESTRTLSVGVNTALVRDDESGVYLMSGGLGTLTGKLLEMREPLWLTDEDAISVAVLIPLLKQSFEEGCRVEGGGAERSDRVLFGLDCSKARSEKSCCRRY